MILVKKFEFEAAHNLIEYKGKCENVHGHSYKLIVKLDGQVDKNGFVIDFVDITKIVEEDIIKLLDHTNLNNIIKQPTAENIAIWIWDKLVDKVKTDNAQLYEIEVWESRTSGVYYRGQ